MKFYAEKLRKLRKQKGVTIEELASQIDSNRTSISKWERGFQTPSEKRIRMLATGLDIPVSEISDLEGYSKISEKLPEITQSWVELAESSSESLQNMQEEHFSRLSGLFKVVEESSIIVKALLKSLPVSFYIKSPSLYYVTVNNHFYKEILTSFGHKNIVGLRDKDIFPIREALANEKEDKEVISTTIPVVNKEQFMPGTRKKRTVLITKTPIFDKLGKVIGLIGIFVDITDRKNAEEQRSLLESAINKLPYTVFIGDLKNEKFHYSFLSEGVEKIFGAPPEVFTQNVHVITDFTYENDKKRHSAWRTDPGFSPNIELRAETREGLKWLRFEREKEEIRGKLYHFGTIRDITERKENELNLKKLFYVINHLKPEQAIVWFGKNLGTKDFQLEFVSDAQAKFTGIPKEQFYKDSLTWEKMIHPDDKDRVLKCYKKGTTPKPIEYRLNTKYGTKWVENNLLEDSFLDKKFQFGVTRDITERKEHEQRIKKLVYVINKLPEIVWFGTNAGTDDFKVNFINDPVEKITHITKKQIYNNGTIARDLIHPEDRKKVFEWLQLTDSSKKLEYRYNTKDGIKWIEDNQFEDFFGEEKIQFGISRDITERKEQDIKIQEREYLLNQLSDLIWIGTHKEDFNLVYLNDAVEKITGTPKQKFYESRNDEEWQNLIHPDDKNKFFDWFKNAHFPKTLEYRINTPEGTKWVQDKQFKTILNGKDYQFGITGDITERKKNNQKSEALEYFANKKLEVNWIKSTNKEASTVFISETTKQLYGVNHTEFVKNADSWLTFIHPDDKKLEMEWNKKRTYPYLRKYRIVTSKGKSKLVEHNSYLDQFEDRTHIFEIIKEV